MMVTQSYILKLIALLFTAALFSGQPAICSRSREASVGGVGGGGDNGLVSSEALEQFLNAVPRTGNSRQARSGQVASPRRKIPGGGQDLGVAAVFGRGGGGGSAGTTGNAHRRPRRGNHLQFYGIEVPVYKFRGEDAQLKCNYDRRNDPLYSVKWYKDDHEFFSFMSKRTPPKKTFPRAGVEVDIHRSNNHLVLLKNLTFESSGIYKCEVSADSPFFHTYYNESVMVVVELPDDGPKISGGQTHYAQGDTARFNCTSSRSKPAAELTWFINDYPVKPGYLVSYYPYEHSDGLVSRRLGLSFTVEKSHFREGEMSLRCEAVVAAVYDPVGQDEAKVLEREPPVLGRGEASITVLSGAQAALPTYVTLLMAAVLSGEHAVT